MDSGVILHLCAAAGLGTDCALLVGMTAEEFLAHKLHPAAASLGVIVEAMFPGRYIVSPRVNRKGAWVYGMIDATSAKVWEGGYCQALRWLASQAPSQTL